MTILLLLCLLLVPSPALAAGLSLTEVASVQVEDARFYTVLPLAGTGGEGALFAAGGQIHADGMKQGYLTLLKCKGSDLVIVAQDRFPIRHGDLTLPGRVRQVIAVPLPGENAWLLFATGRAGSDDGGVGFLRSVKVKDGRFLEGRTTIFSVPGRAYTHGYSLATGDLDGDGRPEVIYGGFSHEDGVDHPDVRIIRPGDGGELVEDATRPFATLPRPMRVNALLVEDLDRDGAPELIIAGRARVGEIEKGALAVRSRGATVQTLLDTSLPSRLRCLTAVDLDGDGSVELITGGRLEHGDRWETVVTAYRFDGKALTKIGDHRRLHDSKIRLRTLAPVPGTPSLLGAGRFRGKGKEEEKGWTGFVRLYGWEKGGIVEEGEPVLVKKGHDTRIRDLVVAEGGSVTCAGFLLDTEKKSTATVTVYGME